MNRTTPERRANRRRKIAQRKRLLENINSNCPEIKDGYLDNNNEVNKYSHRGKSKKNQNKTWTHILSSQRHLRASN